MSNADRSIWQFPKNVANKVPGWRSDGKGLENKDWVDPVDLAADLAGKQDASANLTTLAGIVPGTAGQAILADALVADVRTYISAAPYVATRTALKALDTTKDTRALFDGSIWDWTAGDLSTQVTADTLEGIYAKADAIATTAGAWVRRYPGFINVKWFGATGNGSTDDTAAIQAAIDILTTLITTQALGGATLFLPRGGYLITSSLNITEDYVTLRGEGRFASAILAANSDFNLINADQSGSALFGFTMTDMAVSVAGAATAGALIRLDDVLDGTLENLSLRGFWNGIDLVGSNRVRITNVTIDQSTRTSSAGNDAIRLIGDATAGRPSDIHMSDIQVLKQGSFGFASAMKITGVDGVYVQNSHFIDGTRLIHIVPDDTSGNDTIASIKFANCYFDTCTTNSVLVSGTASTAYRSISFANCTFRGCGDDAYLSNPTSQVTDVSFVGCDFRQNVGRGMYFSDGDVDQVVISACIFDDNNTGNAAGDGDIRLDGGSNIILTGSMFIGGGAAGTAVNIGAAVSGMLFGQCDVSASTAGTKVSNAGSTIRINSVRGYTLKNRGTATILNGATTAAVNHGLDATPSLTDIHIALSADAAGVTRFWLSNATSTQFTINVNATPTVSAQFLWGVDMER